MQLHKLLVAMDFSDHASRALRWGASLAARYGARITLLHVIPATVEEVATRGSDWEQVIIDLTAKVEAQLEEVAVAALEESLLVDVKVAVGKPPEEILRVARQETVDLIVMGTHGHTGLHHILLGSTAETVLRTAPCPVLMVRLPTGSTP